MRPRAHRLRPLGALSALQWHPGLFHRGPVLSADLGLLKGGCGIDDTGQKPLVAPAHLTQADI